jgi:hypothetical protein
LSQVRLGIENVGARVEHVEGLPAPVGHRALVVRVSGEVDGVDGLTDAAVTGILGGEVGVSASQTRVELGDQVGH